MTDTSEEMILTQHKDGRVTANRFPATLRIARELLEEPEERYLTRSFRTVQITLANGTALYRLRRAHAYHTYEADRVALTEVG